MFTMGLFDITNDGSADADVTSEDHNNIARELSASSHILLQNKDNLLPLKLKSSKVNKEEGSPTRIIMIGKHTTEPIFAGGGSGAVFPAHVITPYHGLMNALGMDTSSEIMTKK